MKIHGREVVFCRNVWADCELDDYAKGDLNNLDKWLSGTTAERLRTAAKIISVLSEGGEMAKSFEDSTYKPAPLSMAEVMSLDEGTFSALFGEAMATFAGDAAQTVEAETPKKKEEAPEPASS